MSRSVLLAVCLAACACRDAAADTPKPQILLVELQCNDDGELTGMILAGRRIEQPKEKDWTQFDELTKRLRAILEKAPGVANPGEYVIEVDAPDNLKYEHIIRTISAVSGYVPETGGEPRPLAKAVRLKSKDDGRPLDDNLKLDLPKLK
jgi:hypothetical protein